VRRQLQTLAPDLPYVNVRVLREVVDWQYQAWRLGAVMFGMIGGLALLVAAVGLYSVVAYGVARRTPELGIRAALGARGGDIVRLVVGGGVRYATIGVILGSGVALLVAPRIGSLLFDVSPREPVILVTGALTLIGVTVLACIVPAWRATRVDPAAALKAE
jgi:ABC-type antimicrobial peptide transport system permease subunit